MPSPRSRSQPAPVWLAAPIAALALAVALLFGWLVQQRIVWLVQAPRVAGVVVELTSRREAPRDTRTQRPGTRLEVVTEVQDTGRPRFTTLAPLYYLVAAPGDRVTVLDTSGLPGDERFVLAHPAHLALLPLVALLPLGFLFAIADTLMVPATLKRHWRAAFATALLLPLVAAAWRAL